MPSFQWLKPFSKKKAHGNKYHDYHHGYDNLRHSSYPTTSPTMMANQQHQYNQAPPMHSLSHRQHLYPQQLIMQSPPPSQPNQLNQPQHHFSPQVIITSANSNAMLTSANNHQCQCNQCSFQQPQMQIQIATNNHQIRNPQHQLLQHQQSPPAQSISQTQMAIINSSPQQQSQQQQVSQQLQPVQVAQLQQHQHPHQQCQHMHQPQQLQQPVYQCQNSLPHNGYVNPSLTNNNTLAEVAHSPPQAFAQCTCQHCPFQHQQQQQQQPQQSLSSQQQFMQQLDHVQTNGTCQHQMTSAMVHNGSNSSGNQPMTHLQNNTHNHIMQQQQQTCQQTTPAIITSSTPGTPQQLTHSNTMNSPQQFQYHTIQPAQYQQQMQQMQQMQHQQMQQQQHHQRVQSLHHQQTQPIQQITHQSLQGVPHLAQSHNQLTYHDHPQPPEVINQPQQCQLESRAHDYSRYANMQSLMDNTQGRADYNQISKYQEHVYYNQKPELPPYEPPPDYETFIEHRKMYAIESNRQHMTHHSESPALQKAKDSSYENLRTKSSLYSNLCVGLQEPGYIS